MEQIRFAEEAKVSSTNGGSSFDEALKIIYQSISDLNEQLPGTARSSDLHPACSSATGVSWILWA